MCLHILHKRTSFIFILFQIKMFFELFLFIMNNLFYPKFEYTVLLSLFNFSFILLILYCFFFLCSLLLFASLKDKKLSCLFFSIPHSYFFHAAFLSSLLYTLSLPLILSLNFILSVTFIFSHSYSLSHSYSYSYCLSLILTLILSLILFLSLIFFSLSLLLYHLMREK